MHFADRVHAGDSLVEEAANHIAKHERKSKAQAVAALDSCLQHRASSLQYEQNYVLKSMSKDHRAHIDQLDADLERQLQECIDQIDIINVTLGTTAAAHSEKIDLLDKNFKQELDKMRGKYDEFVLDFEKAQKLQVERLRHELGIRKLAEFQAIGTERNSHTNLISAGHDRSMGELQQFFDTLLLDTSSQINLLEDRIKNIQDKHASVKVDIQKLQEKTACDEQPLELAEMQRLHLVQEVQKVDIGIIAHKNFKESSKELDFKLDQIRRDTKTHERLIKKLLHDKERLTDSIENMSRPQ